MFTLLFGIYTFVICTVMLLLSVVAFVLTVPFDKQRKVVHELSRALVYMFVMVPPMWKRRVEGLEHIEKDKPYVIVINHQSMVDIMMLYLVPMTFRWVSKREVYRIPFIGRFLLLHGDITIDRKQGSKAMRKVMEKGQMWLGRGVSVSMFPEGTRSKDGEIHRFKAGAFALAKEAGVRPGTALAYLIAPPLEGMYAMDAALKAADVSLCKLYAPPTETNFGGGLLSGSRSACEAACAAFRQAVADVAAAPIE